MHRVKKLTERWHITRLLVIALVSLSIVHCESTTPDGSLNTLDSSNGDWQSGAVSVAKNGFFIGGKPYLLRGGSVQWFRMPEASWEDRLQKFKAAGFNTIDMYVAWRNHEPQEGRFDFETYDIRKFLELAKKYELFIYFRVGPYITNEMDGGGLPGWVMAKSSKKERTSYESSLPDSDGKWNLRTNDKAYLEGVERYFAELNQVIQPYLYSQGGPIVLYSIENEYNWFEIFAEADKSSRLKDGSMERPREQDIDVYGTLTNLKKIVQSQGIDVPITTSPGRTNLDKKRAAKGKDGIPGMKGAALIPMPNIYGDHLKLAEFHAWRLLNYMHDKSMDSGVYANYPSGISETDRIPASMRRLIIGGLDAVMHFNIIGMAAEDRQNAIVLNAGEIKDYESAIYTLKNMTELSWNSVNSGFVRPLIGYFHNVVDYYGAVSPSGQLRESFFDFRRTNLFFNSFETLIAAAHSARKTTQNYSLRLDEDADYNIHVDSAIVGVPEGKNGRRVQYWLPLGENCALLGLFNEGDEDKVITKGKITIFGTKVPKYTDMVVSITDSVKDASGTYNERQNLHFMPIGFPLVDGLKLNYSTAEVLTWQDFNDEKILVLYGKAGTKAEAEIGPDSLLDPHASIDILSVSKNITIESREAGTLAFSFTIDDIGYLTFAGPTGIIRVITLDTAMASRSWFTKKDGKDIMLVNVDYIKTNDQQLILEFPIEKPHVKLTVLSPMAIGKSLGKVVSPYDPTTLIAQYQIERPSATPRLVSEINRGRATSELSANLEGDERTWVTLGAEPTALGYNGIYEGHTWYKAEFDVANLKADHRIYIDSASDISALYINNNYLLTLVPIGTEIYNKHRDKDYAFKIDPRFIKPGKNVLHIKNEIWGYGSFMWPRGVLNTLNIGKNMSVTIPFVRLQAPALGFDAAKGIIGRATFNGAPITNWRVSEMTKGELYGYHKRDFQDDSWPHAATPLQLKAGDVYWYRTSFSSHDLPEANFSAPVVLSLSSEPGTAAKATIYLNNRIIGRWISDKKWLKRGGWTQPIRDMWMNTNPDDFPIAKEALIEGENVLAIMFEDTSDQTSGEKAAVIKNISLEFAKERLLSNRNDVTNELTGERNLDHESSWRQIFASYRTYHITFP